MRGHIRKKGKNYYIVLELEPIDGERRQKTISVRKELNLNRPAKWSEADKLLTQKLKELHDGTYFEPAMMTLKEYLARWLDDYVRLNCKPKTIELYEGLIDNHIVPEIGDIQLKNLRPAHVQRLITVKSTSGRLDGKEGGLSKRTIQAIVVLLRHALNQAIKWEYVHRNAATGIKTKSPDRKKPLCWDREEVKTFLNAIKDHRLYPLYLMALTTGMRRGELLGLRWQDVNIKQKKISIRQSLVQTSKGYQISTPKTPESERTIDISEKLSKVLSSWETKQKEELMALGKSAERELVFTSEAGTPITPRNLNRNFKYLTSKAKVKQIKFHTLRDTYATLQLEEGVPLKAVAETLGHTNEVMLISRYAHALPHTLQDAATRLDNLVPD